MASVSAADSRRLAGMGLSASHTDLGQMLFLLFSPIIEQIKYPFEKCLQLIAALGKDQCPLPMEGEAETRRLQTASGLLPHLGEAKQKTHGLGSAEQKRTT